MGNEQGGLLEEARKVCRQMTEAGYPTMMAGGCVRDRLMGKVPKDYDLATTALPTQVIALFKNKGYKIIPVGIEHGTVCLVTPLQHLEITTLRNDVETNGRHATVAFSTSFQEDAIRRDLTINALFEDDQGNVHDYVGGVEDIKHKRLRFVGDATMRIREDYLRILRYFRFLSRLGWEARESQLAAIVDNAAGLKQLSAERIHKEMQLLMMAPHAAKGLLYLAESGVLNLLFPFYERNSAAEMALIEKMSSYSSTLHWFSFYHLGGGPFEKSSYEKHLKQLRFSRKEAQLLQSMNRLLGLADQHMESGVCLLRLARKDAYDLGELRNYFQEFGDSLGLTRSKIVDPLLDGLVQLPAPTIPEAALLAHPAKERGQIVDLTKICWYLRIARDKSQIEEIISHPSCYVKQVNDGSF